MNRRVVTLVLACIASAALGWSAPGHRTITHSAISLLPDEMPAWVRDPAIAAQIAYQSNEPDRWRGTRLPVLEHENGPDHYLDAELLGDVGLTLRTLPALRYDFVLAIGRARPAGERRGVTGPDVGKVGFLPYAIAEHYAKLVSSFNTVRILEHLDDPGRAHQLAAARANAVYHMGQLSHFVGDAAQPLHTTIHHHGWVGPNPKGYTTAYAFHRYIDGDIVEWHALNVEGLGPFLATTPRIEAEGVWDAVIAHVERSHAAVEPLYVMEKSGALREDAGRAFIAERMADAAMTLAGLYWSAWRAAEPTAQQVQDWVRYNALDAEAGWRQRTR